MTLDDLISRLEEIRDAYGDHEVQVAVQIQPSYPLVKTLEGVWNPADLETDEDEPESVHMLDGEPVVFLVSGEAEPYGMNPYGQSAAWDER